MTKLVEITGKSISGEWGDDDLIGDGVPVLRTANFTNEGKIDYTNVITRQFKKNIDKKLLKKGDIIIEKSGGSDKYPVGRVVFFDKDDDTYLFNNFTGLLRVQNQYEWNAKYVFYTLLSFYRKGGTRKFENKTTGLHNLKLDNYINRVEVKQCSLTLQNKIVVKLDKIYSIIEDKKNQLKLLDQLIKSRFVEMFGDPSLNEKCWNTYRLHELCKKICGGGTPSKSHIEYYSDATIPWVTSKDMKSNYIYSSKININENGVKHSSAKIVPSNSVIVVIRSGILKHTLPVAINKVPVTVNQDLKVFIPNENMNSLYLLHLLKISETNILGNVRAVTADNIEFNVLKDRMIIVPPIELQNQFADFVQQVDKSKFEIQKSLEETQKLYDCLMQKYFG